MVPMLEHFVQDEDPSYETEHNCAGSECGATLFLTEDIVLVQIVLPQHTGDLKAEPFQNALGRFAYAPSFLHEHCWQECNEGLHDSLQDLDVQPVEDPQAVLLCEACGSGIRLNEPTCQVSLGLLETSKRCPDGRDTVVFYSTETQFLCLSCARTINEEVLELWPDGLSYANECPQCTYARVWRTGQTCPHPRVSTP